MPEKAKYSEQCTRCGVCCALSLCPPAEQAFPGASAPCPALDFDADECAECGLVAAEKTLGMNIVQKLLGIGCGCSCPDEDTTESQIETHDQLSYIKMFGEGGS